MKYVFFYESVIKLCIINTVFDCEYGCVSYLFGRIDSSGKTKRGVKFHHFTRNVSKIV